MRLSSQLIAASVGLVSLTAVAVGFFVQNSLEQQLVPAELVRIETDAQIFAERLAANVDAARADVLALRGAEVVDSMMRASENGGSDPRTGLPMSRLRTVLSSLFAAQIEAKQQYVQLRLIGLADGGRELIRVDRGADGTGARIVPDGELQKKGDRTYFRDTIGLAPGELYVSKIELNQEFGRIEVPHLPVLRIATPVRHPDGRPFGILIVNIDMRPVFTQLAAQVSGGETLYVTNREGDFLVHPDPALTFGFDLGARHRLQGLFPGLSELDSLAGRPTVIREQADGVDHALAIARVPPESGVDAYIAMTVPRNLFMAPVEDARRSSFIVGVLAALVAIGIAIVVARAIARPIGQVATAVEAIGGSEKVVLPDSHIDEVRSLVGSVERFVEQEFLFRATLDSAEDAIITQRLDGTITSWNPAAARMYGYSAEEAIGQSIDIVVPENRRDEVRELLTRISAGERVEHAETVRQRRDGTRLQVSLSISPVRDVDGVVVGASKIARDITEERRVRELVRLAVQANPAGMIVVDDSGSIVLANAAADKMFGYEPGDLLGCPIEELVPDTFRKAHLDLRNAYQNDPSMREMGVDLDLRGRRRDGSEFPVEIGLNPLTAGLRPQVLAVVADITERREAEARLAEQREELERSNAELAQFAYVASHDLQEPLRMVSSFCDLLEKSLGDRLTGDEKEYIDFAVDGARRMQQLITDLLSYSRLNTRPPAPVVSSAADAVELVRHNLKLAIEETGARIDAEGLPDVVCDRVQLVQLFQNLISNAIKFRSDKPPHIRISTEKDGSLWTFSVADNGIGIDPDKRQVVFGVFQRLHTRDEYPGTGIGLAVCQKIVERNGGAMWIDSADGPGTIFRFTLPAADGVVHVC